MLRTHGWTHNVKTVFPPQIKFGGGYNKCKIFAVVQGRKSHGILF